MDDGKCHLFHFITGRLCVYPYKDSKKAPEAARVMKVTAADLKELGLIERIIPEEEPANTDTLYRIAGYMDRSMVKFMKKYQDMSGEELAEHRYERFRRM